MVAPTRTLSTAEERRETVLAAAERVFAARGLHGTPTTAIAEAAGISHAYLFRLFPTKTELFVATFDRVSGRLAETFAGAAASARAAGEDPLHAMGMSYMQLLEDRTWLLVQLHAHSACDEPAVREAVRACFARLVDLVRRETGADDAKLSSFFATGMLLNAMAAMRTDEVADEPWVQTLMCLAEGDDPPTPSA